MVIASSADAVALKCSPATMTGREAAVEASLAHHPIEVRKGHSVAPSASHVAELSRQEADNRRTTLSSSKSMIAVPKHSNALNLL